MGSSRGPDEVLVQQPGIGAQDRVEIGAGHGGASRCDLKHPEYGGRLGIFLRLADRCREAAQRCGHCRSRLVERRALDEIDPRDAQMRGVRKAFGGYLAAFEGPGQRHVSLVQHFYYDIVASGSDLDVLAWTVENEKIEI